MRATVAVLAAGLALCVGASSAWADTWGILPTQGRGVDEGAAETFRELLQGELGNRTGASFVYLEQACRDVPCALEAGRSGKADVVVLSSLNTLGQKIIATTTVVRVSDGEVSSTQKIAVDRLEDLDSAAERIAAAITTGSSTDETAQLGNITHEEVKPELRREGQSGLGLRVGALLPLADGYGGAGPGVAIDASYWYETSGFAIEPRFGVRFTADPEEPNSYFEMPIDVGAYYIMGKGDFAPFFGGGGGLRFLAESRVATVRTGTVITTESETELDDSAFGFGLFGRAGLLLFRTYTLRLGLTADYNVTFVDLNGKTNPQSFTAGIAVFF
jgi:hypothetical protein